MSRTRFLLLLALGGALYLGARQARAALDAEAGGWPWDATVTPEPNGVILDPATPWEPDVNTGATASAETNLAAFLALIRRIEAGDRYDIIAGGDTFTDYSEHPFILAADRPRPAGTTAAGAYQMVVGTWKMARNALGLPDFSPESQDRAAVWIMDVKRPGALADVLAGNFDSAVNRLTEEWDAFKRIKAGTYNVTLAQARGLYEQNGGTFA